MPNIRTSWGPGMERLERANKATFTLVINWCQIKDSSRIFLTLINKKLPKYTNECVILEIWIILVCDVVYRFIMHVMLYNTSIASISLLYDMKVIFYDKMGWSDDYAKIVLSCELKSMGMYFFFNSLSVG